MIKILWLSPTLNHYKVSFLEYLHQHPYIDLTVISGMGRKNQGDPNFNIDVSFLHYQLPVKKNSFGFSPLVRKKIKELYKQYDWIMIPREKKFLLLIFYIFFLKIITVNYKKQKVKLISYNHPISRSSDRKITYFDKILTKFLYNNIYDRIIFYTEKSCKEMVKKGFIKKEKAFWANNTVNNIEIKKYYSFCYPPINNPTILFIGRLIPRKKLEVFIEYYFELSKLFKKKGKKLKAIIIGDGPKKDIVINAMSIDPTIEWLGALSNEKDIAKVMEITSVVFVPGHSGLSINHAFSYGRPYITFENEKHPPEIEYIIHGYNGLILNKKDKKENLKLILSVFENIEQYCDNARKSGEKYSIENWRENIIKVFMNDLYL